MQYKISFWKLTKRLQILNKNMKLTPNPEEK